VVAPPAIATVAVEAVAAMSRGVVVASAHPN
jgi:hypothetical protein